MKSRVSCFHEDVFGDFFEWGTGLGNEDTGCPPLRSGSPPWTCLELQNLETSSEKTRPLSLTPTHSAPEKLSSYTKHTQEDAGNQNYLGDQIPEKVTICASSPRQCAHSWCIFLYGEKGINERIYPCLSSFHSREDGFRPRTAQLQLNRTLDKNLHRHLLHLIGRVLGV